MTDLKLKNDSDRLQLGIRLLSFADCSLFIYCINHCLIDHCLALTAPLNAHTHFISFHIVSLTHHLTVLFICTLNLHYFNSCLTVWFWIPLSTYLLSHKVLTYIFSDFHYIPSHFSLSLVLIEAFYWAFTPTSACTHNYTFIQRQTNWHFPCSLLTIPFFTFLWNEQSTPLYYCEPLIMRYSTRIWSLLCKNYNPALESRPF